MSRLPALLIMVSLAVAAWPRVARAEDAPEQMPDRAVYEPGIDGAATRPEVLPPPPPPPPPPPDLPPGETGEPPEPESRTPATSAAPSPARMPATSPSPRQPRTEQQPATAPVPDLQPATPGRAPVTASAPVAASAPVTATRSAPSAATSRRASAPARVRPKAAADAPHVILISVSGLSSGRTGYEGHKLIKTPNLDRLAGGGVWFSAAYASSPQAASTRATLLTGVYPHIHKVAGENLTMQPRMDSLADLFWASGYRCGVVGNLGLPPAMDTKPGLGFDDYVAAAVDPSKPDNPEVAVNGVPARTDKPLLDWQIDRAIDALGQAKQGPLFLYVCLSAPGLPAAGTAPVEGPYAPQDVDVPPLYTLDPNARPGQLNMAPPVRQFAEHRGTLRQDRARHYAAITRVDAALGRLLSRLDELKPSPRTVVAFTSDSGLALGEHGLYGTGPFFHDVLVRVPMIIRAPGLLPEGRRMEGQAELVDLPPTLLQLAGLPSAPAMQGRSLVERIMEGRRAGEEAFIEFESLDKMANPARAIVSGTFTFVDYLQGNKDVLFDNQWDAHQTTNLVDDKHYAGPLKALRLRLETWRRQTRDVR